MTLLDYCKTRKGETEVWDEYVDIRVPYYNYDGDFCFANNEEDHFLFLTERWLLSLEVTSAHGDSCSVDCFHAIQQEWPRIIQFMKEGGSYTSFLSRYDEDDDEAIADFVEDIFTTLSQGYYGIAEDFCWMLDLVREYESDMAAKCEAGEYEIVPLNEYPDPDIFYYCLSDLDWDGSQGTGNLVFRHFYFPAADMVGCYADF